MRESTARHHANRVLVLAALAASGCAKSDVERPDAILALDSRGDDTASLPVLEPAISSEETTTLREGFSWDAFDEVPERDASGRPALHYVLLYMQHSWQVDYLRAVGIHHSFVPLFEEERARWQGQAGVFTLEGDREGVFAFALVPGRFLNVLREAAADGEEPFGAVVLRDAPAPATTAEGFVSYEFLADDGFAYDGVDAPEVGGAASPILDTPVRVLRAAVSPIEDLIDEVRAFFGELDALAAGRARITVSVLPLRTAASFGLGTVMRRGWGHAPSSAPPGEPVLGEALFLRNARIQSHKGASLFRGRLGHDGRAVFEVAKGEQNLCVELANDAAEVTNFLTALVLCNFNDPSNPDLNLDIQEDITIRMDVQDYRVNIFAQMQDGYDYAQYVFGHSPRQARVMTGFFADVIGEINGGRAFAPCLGNGLDVGSTFLQLLPLLGVALPADIDIAFPFDTDVSANSRGVPTHEYGHFISCDMMHATNAWKYAENWVNVIVNALGVPGAENDSAFVHEGFADFFTMQVVGGTNYPALHGSTGGGNVNYCPTSGPDLTDCAEDNVGGTDEDIGSGVTYNYGIARIATLWHDAFDGAQFPDPGLIAPSRGAAFPHDGAIFTAPVFAGTNAVDEQVVLPGPAMQQFFRRLFDHVSTMNERNFNNALARTARQFGHTEEEICEMFSLHAGVPGVPGIPGTPDYTTCPDMVDRAALATTRIPPSTPTGIVVRRNPSDPSIATIEWEDLSLVATGFSFRITGEDGLDRTRSVPYARNASVDQTGLAGDTEYTVTITTLNGDGEASTTTTFVTFALPPEGVMASPGPGSATLTWMPPPSARGYQISRVAPDVATLFTTPETTAQVRGLSDVRDYRCAVASLNRLGEPGLPVASNVVRPDTPSVFYVAPDGDDGARMAGTQDTPFASVSAAVDAAVSRDADAVWLLAGDYVETNPIRVGSDLDLIGGFSREPDGTYVPDGDGMSFVQLTGVAGTGVAPRTRLFNNPSNRPARSAVLIEGGADVLIRGVSWSLRTALTATECTAALHVFGTLSLEQSDVETRATSAASRSCSAAIIASPGASLRVTDVDARGFVADALVFAPTRFETAAIAMQGDSLELTDTTLVGLSRGIVAGGLTAALASGVTASVGSLRATRITAQTVSPVTWVFGAGRIAGLDALVSDTCIVDDSVLRSAIGGDEAYGASVQPFTAPLDAITLAHVTAIVGADWPLVTTLPSGYVGAAVRVAGLVDELVLVNSVLSYAGGGRRSGARYAALDLSGLTRAFTHVSARGNVFSLPLLTDAGGEVFAGNIRSLIYCQNSEFGAFVDEADLNATYAFQCPMSGSTVGWSVGNNRRLVRRPEATSVDRAMFPHVAAFDADGVPIPPEAGLMLPMEVLRSTDVALSSIPRFVSAPRDRAGTPRAGATNACGAWIF